jgi:hypothetical protein
VVSNLIKLFFFWSVCPHQALSAKFNIPMQDYQQSGTIGHSTKVGSWLSKTGNLAARDERSSLFLRIVNWGIMKKNVFCRKFWRCLTWRYSLTQTLTSGFNFIKLFGSSLTLRQKSLPVLLWQILFRLFYCLQLSLEVLANIRSARKKLTSDKCSSFFDTTSAMN